MGYVDQREWADAILVASPIEYLLIHQDRTICEASAGVGRLLGQPEAAPLRSDLLELIPALIGYEDVFTSVLNYKSPQFSLPMFALGGEHRADDTLFLELTLQPFPAQDQTDLFLLLLIDVSEQARLKQQVVQQRNELRLMSEQLIDLNHKLNHILRRYVPTNVVDAIIEGQMSQEPGGELREVTILFADMRGYTRVARDLPAAEVMGFLNTHLHLASDAIAKAEGTIAQYMGDAIMAVFNAVVDQPDHSWRAVQAGFYIQEAIASYNEDQAIAKWGEPVGFGVGIFSGPALIGNTGSQWQYAFSAIGNTTNMAYRLTMLAGSNEIYIGEATYHDVQDKIDVTPMPPLDVKGIEQPVPAYRVEGLR